MPTFTTDSGREYHVTGKYLIWVPEQFDDEEPLPEIKLPLRIKLKHLLDIGEDVRSKEAMLAVLKAIAPTQIDVLTEMDVNDFAALFSTWMEQYNQLSGMALGEAQASPAGLTIIEPPQNTTGEPGSD